MCMCYHTNIENFRLLVKVRDFLWPGGVISKSAITFVNGFGSGLWAAIRMTSDNLSDVRRCDFTSLNLLKLSASVNETIIEEAIFKSRQIRKMHLHMETIYMYFHFNEIFLNDDLQKLGTASKIQHDPSAWASLGVTTTNSPLFCV